MEEKDIISILPFYGIVSIVMAIAHLAFNYVLQTIQINWIMQGSRNLDEAK